MSLGSLQDISDIVYRVAYEQTDRQTDMKRDTNNTTQPLSFLWHEKLSRVHIVYHYSHTMNYWSLMEKLGGLRSCSLAEGHVISTGEKKRDLCGLGCRASGWWMLFALLSSKRLCKLFYPGQRYVYYSLRIFEDVLCTCSL